MQETDIASNTLQNRQQIKSSNVQRETQTKRETDRPVLGCRVGCWQWRLVVLVQHWMFPQWMIAQHRLCRRLALYLHHHHHHHHHYHHYHQVFWVRLDVQYSVVDWAVLARSTVLLPFHRQSRQDIHARAYKMFRFFKSNKTFKVNTARQSWLSLASALMYTWRYRPFCRPAAIAVSLRCLHD